MLVSACASAPKPQRPRVAVVEFEGKRASQWQDRVTALVDSQHRWDIVPPEAYTEAARKIGAESSSSTDLARVAAELNATAIIVGRIVGKSDKRAKFQLAVHDGETGKVIDKLTLRVRKGKLSGKGDRLLRKKLLAALDDSEPRAVDAPAPKSQPDAPSPAKPAAAAPEDEPVAKAEPKSAKAVKGKPAASDQGEGEKLDLETDDNGQVLDDEWPDGLKK